MLSHFRIHLSVALVAMLLAAPVAFSDAAPHARADDHPWFQSAEDPTAAREALADHPDKVPPEFHERLQHALPDGTLRVMVALTDRDPATEAFAQRHSVVLDWYGDAPRYLARITPDQLAPLLSYPAVAFVEPDYPLTHFLAESVLDIAARAASPGAGHGIWSFDPAAGPMGALRSEHPSFHTPLTGAGVTVAVIDGGVDKTHRDFGGWDCAAGAYAACDTRIRASVAVDQVVDTGGLYGDTLPTTDLAGGHGTHVAGTVLGNGYYVRDGDPDDRYGGDGVPIGVAPEAALVMVKNGELIWAGLSTGALQWTLDHAEEYDIRVTTNSWGCVGGCSFSPTSATARVLEDLYHAGVVNVFAVGNDGGSGSGAEFSGYAQSPYVVGVANYDDATGKLAESSSRGSRDGANSLADPAAWTPESEDATGVRRPDVAAPGTSIWAAASLTGGAASGAPRVATSDVTGGGSLCCTVPYRTMTGTSMAAPHVSGVVALLVDACAQAAPVDLMRAVYAGADADRVRQTTGGATAEPFEVGYGGLDARASLDWLLDQTVCGGTQDATSDDGASEPAASSTGSSGAGGNQSGGDPPASDNQTKPSPSPSPDPTPDDEPAAPGPSPENDTVGAAMGADGLGEAPSAGVLLVLAAAAVALLGLRRRRA